MWNKITCNDDINDFMSSVCYFHDSCIKEMRYVSGAYVNDKLGMSPINDKGNLYILLQRQVENNSTIEMKFEGLKYLHLLPCGDDYTCEILNSTMLIKNDLIYWCDSDTFPEGADGDLATTIICAEKLYWRSVDHCLGAKEFYTATY